MKNMCLDTLQGLNLSAERKTQDLCIAICSCMKRLWLGIDIIPKTETWWKASLGFEQSQCRGLGGLLCGKNTSILLLCPKTDLRYSFIYFYMFNILLLIYILCIQYRLVHLWRLLLCRGWLSFQSYLDEVPLLPDTLEGLWITVRLSEDFSEMGRALCQSF